MTSRHSDDPTHWGPQSTFRAGWGQGWRAPGHGENISIDDPYWGQVLDRAKQSYGDPNIHFNTSDAQQERYLVFGDGTRLPEDGTIVYRDAASNKTWVSHEDGSFALLDKDGHEGKPFQPTAWRKIGDEYAPVDEHGTQIGRQQKDLGDFPSHTDPKTGLITPIDKDGNYYELDPATGKAKYFDKDGKPTSGPGQHSADTPGAKPPAGQATADALAAGMHLPHYPPWADANNVGVETQMTETLARLYNMFGAGTPATPSTPAFPFHTDDGVDSGIDRYTALRSQFKALESEFDASTKAFGDAVKDSKFKVESGRDAINKAIDDFGDKVHSLPEGQFGPLVQAEADMLSSVRTTVANAATHHTDVPDPAPAPAPSPTPGPAAPGPDPLEPLPGPPTPDPTTKKLSDLIDKLGGGGGMPFGGMPGLGGIGNPLGGLGGMNPLGGGGQGISPLGAGGAPAPAVAKLTDPNNDPAKPAVTPLNPPAPPGVPTPAPVPSPGPATDPSGNGGGPAVVPVGNASGPGTTVSLPDGKTVDAPNSQAAKAATNAITNASPGGDPAQKAYSGVMELPGDGKNLGAKVDPGDMQAGDVLKWQDKTMVAAGPGLVADPTHPNVVHQLQDVLKDGKGFQGIFRPTAVDPTLTSHSAPPPVVDVADQHPPAPPDHPPATPPNGGGGTDHPAPPPAGGPAAPAEPAPSTIPLASPAAPAPPPPPPAAPAAAQTGPEAHAAPPSPFGPHTPPAATRSTKADRIAAGTEQ